MDSHDHDLTRLMRTAGLWSRFNSDMQRFSALNDNWAVVKDWSVETRYQLGASEALARDLFSACTARTHGVLSWLKKSW